jgi:protein SCO1/2
MRSKLRLGRIVAKYASICVFALANDAFANGDALSTNKPACCQKELAAGAPLPDRSIFQIDSEWTNDRSNTVKLASLRGRPQIVTMFFAQCQFTCPILVHSMTEIETALPENIRTNVGFVLISFDSERDTPAALANYRRAHELGPNWTLLRGGADDVLELGALLGVKFKKDSAGNFAHSNMITLLNAEGEIVFQQQGVNRDPVTMVSAVDKLFCK